MVRARLYRYVDPDRGSPATATTMGRAGRVHVDARAEQAVARRRMAQAARPRAEGIVVTVAVGWAVCEWRVVHASQGECGAPEAGEQPARR